MNHIKILGLGHPRTGTGFTSKTLSRFGLKVGHEELLENGIVAWQLLKEYGPWPWMHTYNKLHKSRIYYDFLVYNIRDPRTSIPSIVYTEDIKPNSFNFRLESFNIEKSNNPVEQAILSILKFDELILEMNPDLVYRIEDQAKELYNFANTINKDIEWIEPTNKENSRKHRGIETLKKEMESVKPELQEKINDFCRRHGYKDLFPYKHIKMSVVMMSYLYDYPGSRSNPIEKFNRAVESFVQQSYDDKELIIVSDGCDLTVSEYNANWKHIDNIKLIETEKSSFNWPGSKRQIGVDNAIGDWIVYLDSDDILHHNHLTNIYNEIDHDTIAIFNNTYTNVININITGNPKGWMYINGYKIHYSKLEEKLRKIGYNSNNSITINNQTYKYDFKYLDNYKFGTSRTSHKKDCGVKWTDREARGEDMIFSEALMEQVKYKIINSPTYIVCHIPNRLDI